MAKAPAAPTVEPSRSSGPDRRNSAIPSSAAKCAKAAVWLGMALLVAGIIFLAQPLLLIVGGAIFAVLLDGGGALLGRFLPIARGWRLLIVILIGFGFIGWVIWFAGTTIAEQAEGLRKVVTAQFDRLMDLVERARAGAAGPADRSRQPVAGLGRPADQRASDSAIGALTSIIMMMVIGMFLAAEPQLYDRGIAWMLPHPPPRRLLPHRRPCRLHLRRLLFGRLVGMLFEGVFTFVMLMLGGVPMAALLGLVTGVLAFIPNIGAIISGILMVAVGFSAPAPHRLLCHLRLFLRPEYRWLSGRALHRPADGRPRARAGACACSC